MRRTLDCLILGATRLWAHRPLVLWLWLETALLALMTVGGLMLPLAVAGVEIGPWLSGEALGEPGKLLAAYQVWVERLTEQGWGDLVPDSPAMISALVGMVLLWTLALFVWCFFQGGLYGVLTRSELGGRGRRSPVDRGSRTADVSFLDCGRRYLWRFFGLLHLYLLYLILIQGVWVLVVALAVRSWMAWGEAALLAVGCGGTVPLVLLTTAVTLWFLLARADLAHPASGVRRARLRGWEILKRRPGASLVLGAFFLVLTILASGLLAPFGFAVRNLLDVGSAAWFLARGGLEALQWLLWGALATYVAATLVVFVQDPALRELRLLAEETP